MFYKIHKKARDFSRAFYFAQALTGAFFILKHSLEKSFVSHLLNLLGSVAHLGKYLVVVLAEQRRRAVYHDLVGGKFDLVVDKRRFAGCRVLDLYEHLSRTGDMGILRHLVDAQNMGRGNAGFDQKIDGFLRGSLQ